MKKAALVLLAVLMLLSSCASSYEALQDEKIALASESAPNVVRNGGFETGDLTEWGGSDGVAVSSATAHTGKYSLCFYPTAGVEYTYNVLPKQEFDKDAGAIVSAWVKLPSAFEADKVRIIVEKQMNGGLNQYTEVHPERTSEWQQVHMYVEPTFSGSVQDFVIKAEVNSVRGPVYIDDYEVISLNSESVNYLKNGKFTYRSDSWSNYVESFGRDEVGAMIDLSDTTKPLNQSTGFLPVGWNLKYDGTIDVTFSAYVAPVGDAEGIVRLRVERIPDLGIYYKEFVISPNSGWQKISLDVPASEVACNEAVFYIESVSGSGKVLVDDASVTIANFGVGFDGTSSNAPQMMSPDAIVKPYLTNGDLEGGNNGVSNNWGLAPGWEVLPDSYWANEGIEARSGSGAVFVQQLPSIEQVFLQANGWQDRGTTKEYDATKPMVFKAWVKAENVTGDGVYLRVERKYDVNGAEQVLFSTSEAITGTTDGWVELEAYIEPSDIEFKEILWDVVVTPGEGSVTIDDLTCELTDETASTFSNADAVQPGDNVLRNSGLDELNVDGTTTHWDVWPGNPAEGVRDSEVIEEEGHGNVLKVNLQTSNAQAVYQYCVGDTVGKFDFNQDYTFSCDIKCEGVMTLDGKGVTIGVKRRGVDGNEYNEYYRIDEMAQGWNTYSISPTPAPVDVVQYDVIVDMGSGVGSVYLDNFSLTLAEIEAEAETEELVLAWE